jgi:hypothetical protein
MSRKVVDSAAMAARRKQCDDNRKAEAKDAGHKTVPKTKPTKASGRI